MLDLENQWVTGLNPTTTNCMHRRVRQTFHIEFALQTRQDEYMGDRKWFPNVTSFLQNHTTWSL